MPTTMKLIAKNVLGSDAADLTFSSIPSTFTDLLIEMSIRTSYSGGRASGVYMYLNGSSASIYSWRALQSDGVGASSSSLSSQAALLIGNATSAGATSSTFGSMQVYIPNYAGATNKSLSCVSVTENNGTEAYINTLAGLGATTNTISSLLISGAGYNFLSGSSFTLFGISK